jgi:hypothetical protein
MRCTMSFSSIQAAMSCHQQKHGLEPQRCVKMLSSKQCMTAAAHGVETCGRVACRWFDLAQNLLQAVMVRQLVTPGPTLSRLQQQGQTLTTEHSTIDSAPGL